MIVIGVIGRCYEGDRWVLGAIALEASRLNMLVISSCENSLLYRE